MAEYSLYLESGPKRKTTLAHVIELPGCVQQFPTTDQAIAGAPEMVRSFLRFLARHGEPIDPDAPLSTTVEVEELSGIFGGTGAIPGDSRPLDSSEADAFLAQVRWLHGDTLASVGALALSALVEKPARGRPIGGILAHIVGAEYSYVTTVGFRTPGLHALSAAAHEADDPRALVAELFDTVERRLAGVTAEDRSRIVMRSTGEWTMRRMYRRVLEHNWEHYREIAARLGRAG